MASAEAIVARSIQKAAAQMAVEYAAQRAEDAERLFNAFAEVIGEQRPNVEVLVYVLELLKFSLLEQKHRENYTDAGQAAHMPESVAPPAAFTVNGTAHSH